MAALDYLRLRENLPRSRILFVAHREEILTQSLGTFRQALRDPTFGELWLGTHRPRQFEHVFASIQSLTATGLAHVDPAHFDVIVIDEFHHAAARTYRTLLEHVRPIELLGPRPHRSAATGCRSSIGSRAASQRSCASGTRLTSSDSSRSRITAFTMARICARFHGVRGTGYDVEGLSNLMTGNDALAKLILKELDRHVGDVSRIRALGFCVSVEHARFMARAFRGAGVPAVAIWSDTPDAERRAALTDLAARRVNVVFSVNLFNEGVDVPAVDTLLMLRPTDSPTLCSLQQSARSPPEHRQDSVHSARLRRAPS